MRKRTLLDISFVADLRSDRVELRPINASGEYYAVTVWHPWSPQDRDGRDGIVSVVALAKILFADWGAV
jgi:hypothetical protein